MYDFSLEPKLMNKMSEDVRGKIGSLGILASFGHIGDYNMHLQIACHQASDYQKMQQILEPFVFDYMRGVPKMRSSGRRREKLEN